MLFYDIHFSGLFFFSPLLLVATWEPTASLRFGRTQLHWIRIQKKIYFKKKVSSGSSQTVWYISLFGLWCLGKTASLNTTNFVPKSLKFYESTLYEMWLFNNVPTSHMRSLIPIYYNHTTFYIFILTSIKPSVQNEMYKNYSLGLF